MYCEFIDKLFLHIRFQWVWNITVKSIKHFEQSLNIFYTIYILSLTIQILILILIWDKIFYKCTYINIKYLYTFYVFIYLKYWIIWYIITVYLILNLILKFNQNQKRYKKMIIYRCTLLYIARKSKVIFKD